MKMNKKNGQRGAALIEFTLVLPLLLLMLFGIIEFSVLLYDKAVITNASREAAREWIEHVPDRSVNTPARLNGVVQSYAQNRLISFGSDSVLPQVTFKVDGSPTTATTVYNSASMLAVGVSYTYDFLVLPNFIGGFGEDLTLSAETVMRAE